MGENNEQDNTEFISGAYVDGTTLVIVDGAVVVDRTLIITS